MAGKKTWAADGYIEHRSVLQKTMYFAQIDHPLWYGPLRDTVEEAKNDGREYCRQAGLDVPCFETV